VTLNEAQTRALNLGAVNFLLHESLDGAGTVALQTDPQGKTYGSALSRMELETGRSAV
jgi:shikimate 5-dehydrogenase